MGKTYLDSQEGLTEIIEISNIDWKSKYVKSFIKKTKDTVEEKIEINESNKLFDEIYEKFNIDFPLDNKSIIKIYWWRNKFYFFIDFCNYLIEKIRKSENKKEIAKIPLIVSNLASYKWKHPNQRSIIEKRNELMYYFNEKVKKNKSFSRWKSWIDPNKLY